MPKKVEDFESPMPPEEVVEGVRDVDEDAEVLPVRYTITSFGADFPVDGLVKRIDNEDILVPTFDPEIDVASGIAGFQRHFVWKKPQIDRFIESLLLGFPVPGIFLVQEPNNVLLVLDGQQRLRSLHAFYSGQLRGDPFVLEYVTEAFSGRAYSTLDEDDRRRLDNSIVHATIVRQDAPADDHGSVYSIFERLNTGGTPLQAQEIRVALYRGPFINLLRELNGFPAWRNLYGAPSPRLKDQELILRFLAFFERWKDYERPLKGFLNAFVEGNRHLNAKRAKELMGVFQSTTDAIHRGIGKRAFRPQRALNAAVLDSVMVGVATRLREGPIKQLPKLQPAYEKLLVNNDYLEATGSSTAGEESVESRVGLAIESFAKVK